MVYEHTRTGINGSSSTLDLILTNYPEEINNVEATPDLQNSDHCLVCFNILTKVHRQPKVPHTAYNFKNADFTTLKLALCDIPWELAFLDNDIDVNLLSWQGLFLTCVDQFILKIRIKDPNQPPWIDADVLHLIRKKRKRRRARITDSPYQWSKFRKIRNEEKKIVKFNKWNYIDKLGDSLKSNAKKFWSYYKLITKTSRIPSEISYGQVNATNHMDPANLFNIFFHYVFVPDDLSVNIDQLPESNYNVTSELSSVVMDTNSLSNYLKSLDTSKASMGIPTKLLKKSVQMKLHHHFVCCLIHVLNGVYSLINGKILIWYRYIRVRLSQL